MSGQATISINENQWNVWVANTYTELTTGLGGVASLAAGTGMLFVLGEKRQVTVDTSQMMFPIDIIFISEGLVVDVASNIQPGYLVTEETPCDMFLEVNAGEGAGVEAGDSVATATIQQPGFDWSMITSLAIPLVFLGFVGGMMGGMFRSLGGGSSIKQIERESGKTKIPIKEAKTTRYCPKCGKVVGYDGVKYIEHYSWCPNYGFMPSGEVRRLGEPRSEKEQAKVHEEFYGTKELPARGKGLEERGESTEGRRLGESKTEAERGETHERKYGTRELPKRGAGLEKLLHSAGEDKYIVERAREISRKTGEPSEETLRTLRAPIEAPHYRVLGWIVREDPSCLRGEFGLATGITVNPDLPEKEKKIVIAHEIGHGESICKKLKAGEEVTFGREFECLAWQEGIPVAEELSILDEYLKEYQKEARYLACEHHSMWLTLEQRKGLEEKYGAVAVRWAEEATKPSDVKEAEAAAEYYYKKIREAFGLGHLSPELSEEKMRRLREVLGLPADVAEILRIHQETGYVP